MKDDVKPDPSVKAPPLDYVYHPGGSGCDALAAVAVAFVVVTLLLLALSCSSQGPRIEPEPPQDAPAWQDSLVITWPGAIDVSGLDAYQTLLLAQDAGVLWEAPPAADRGALGSLATGYRLLTAADGTRAELYCWSPELGHYTLRFDACAPDGWPSPDGPTHFAGWCVAEGETLLVQLTDRLDENGHPRLVQRYLPGMDWRRIPPAIWGPAVEELP